MPRALFTTGLDGTRIYVRRHKGPTEDPGAVTAVLCDGIACDGFIWKYLWGELADRCDVAHWHYRGHGRSGAPVDKSRIDIGAHAADLKAVRDDLGDRPTILIGHSMGTQVALEEWHRFPKNVKGLVLICGSYGKVTQSFRGMPILDMILPKLMDIVDKQPDIVRAICDFRSPSRGNMDTTQSRRSCSPPLRR